MAVFITILFSLSLLFIFLFSLSQLHLTFLYLRKSKPGQRTFATAVEPSVTIQLPVYNEKYVVERLLDAVRELDYPKEKLEVQILDDSTDETTALLLEKIESLRPLALDIKLLHRTKRDGYKAGALDQGLQFAKGEFITIFDADFLPEKDFLKKTLPHFADPAIGAVQTRWGHINEDYSLLTSLQAFALNAHFTIEQTARNQAGGFINFNGTCGVWRKHCIQDAGGWSADTLTEDLDLSYRAQMKGWKLHYLEDIVTPGELPVVMSAVKSQQYRWNKGGAENARKHVGKVLSSNVSATQKIHAFFHLLNSSVFLCVLFAGILSVPVLFIKQTHPDLDIFFKLGVLFFTGFFSIALFYYISTCQSSAQPIKQFVKLFPPFLFFSMGLSLHNGVAVAEGFLGIKTPFIRTPKFNIVNRPKPLKGNAYLLSSFSVLTAAEGLLCLYFVAGIVVGFHFNDLSLMFFHVLLALGFGSIFYYSVKPVENA